MSRLQNTLRTLRGEGGLFDRAVDHCKILGINQLRGKFSFTDRVCPACLHKLKAYSLGKEGNLEFTWSQTQIPRPKKLCCVNPACRVKGFDEGHVSSLNMILKFLKGKEFKLKGKTQTPKELEKIVGEKLVLK